jgi:negative elongation factor C/D
MTIGDVQSLIEDHLKQLVIKHFDPKMADTIFKDESGVSELLSDTGLFLKIELLVRHQTG